MKTLMLLALGMFGFTSVAQAQYEDLVQQKLDRLDTLEQRVAAIDDLSVSDKAWALGQLAESQTVLIEMQDGSLEDLQAVEQAINETCEQIAMRVLATKKAKLLGRIAMLDAMIEQYQAAGLDTAELEALSDSMKVQVEGLMQ